MNEPFDTDALDEQIIAALIADGRVSFREIGRRLDVSESAVRQRVRRLHEANAIRIGVVVDLISTGRAVTAWVRAAVMASQLDAVAEKLSALDETTFVATTVGQYNLNAVLVAADLEALTDAVDSHVATINGVLEVDTKLVGRTIAHDFHNAVLKYS